MRLCYVVLSPTFGMYQVVADLANRFCAEHTVHLLAAMSVPVDRFAPGVHIHRLAKSGNSGMELASLDLVTLNRILRTSSRIDPDVVHFAAPHVWNLPLALWLRAKRIPILYSLHDLDPHLGTAYSKLMRLFNRAIIRLVDQLVVYGTVYKERLVSEGMDDDRVVFTPLTHLFLSHGQETALRRQPPALEYERSVLFFGRLEPYKGIDVLLEAFQKLNGSSIELQIAGRGKLGRYLPAEGLPSNVHVRNRHIGDAEAIELFRTCGLVVLPYKDATQSAAISSAYFFRKPVLVTRSGALPEYVVDGKTGYLVDPDNAGQLAERIQAIFATPGQLQEMGQAGFDWYQRKRRLEYDTLAKAYNRAASLH